MKEKEVSVEDLTADEDHDPETCTNPDHDHGKDKKKPAAKKKASAKKEGEKSAEKKEPAKKKPAKKKAS